MKGLFCLFSAVVASSVLALSCSSSKPPSTPTCVHNSDCQGGLLVCSLGYCVKACDTSADCPMGERCINATVATGDGGVVSGTACQAPEIATCTYTSQCVTPLVCSLIDGQCRDMCLTNADCPSGQVCTADSKLCADPTVDKNYNPITMELTPTAGEVKSDAAAGTGGAGGAHTGAGGAGGATGVGGGGGATGAGGAGGGSVSDAGTASDASGSGGGAAPCTTAQTIFGNIAQGDQNPLFTSGVGLRTADKLLAFSAYSGPLPSDGGAADADPDAAPPTGNLIYLQSFDLASGASLGAALPIYQATDGLSFAVYDASIAPTGEIVVLYGRGIPTNATPTALYALFLSPGAAGDGGAAAPQVVRSVQLESVQFGEPNVVWSVASQAFIISWKYVGSAWFTHVRRFQANGQPAGSDTGVVPTPANADEASNWDDGHVGTSGALLGVLTREPFQGQPWLTILDADGLQVGDFINAGSGATTEDHWSTVGGTADGFVTLYRSSTTAYGAFVPTTGAGSVLADGGIVTDGGDGGPPPLKMFNFNSQASTGKMVSDDMGGQGGVGAVLLEPNGASFLYINADASKQLNFGAVIASATGGQVTVSNYHGSFALSLYDTTTHSTSVVASSCR